MTFVHLKRSCWSVKYSNNRKKNDIHFFQKVDNYNTLCFKKYNFNTICQRIYELLPDNWNGFGWKHEREWEKYLTKIITFTPKETWTILLIKRPVLIHKLVFNFGTLTSIKKLQINPNLGGLFRGSFWGGRRVKLLPPLSKTC